MKENLKFFGIFCLSKMIFPKSINNSTDTCQSYQGITPCTLMWKVDEDELTHLYIYIYMGSIFA